MKKDIRIVEFEYSANTDEFNGFYFVCGPLTVSLTYDKEVYTVKEVITDNTFKQLEHDNLDAALSSYKDMVDDVISNHLMFCDFPTKG